MVGRTAGMTDALEPRGPTPAAGFRARLSRSEVESWGESIGREVTLPLVMALSGELGVGKSTLARAVARGAGVVERVPSPTFNLLFVYETPRAVVKHFDLYRLTHAEEVWELGWEEIGIESQLVLIEWADRAGVLLPGSRWDVTLSETEDPERRLILAEPVGQPPMLPSPGGSEEDR